MKILYLECNMGAAGDMLMGALSELVGREAFVEKMERLYPSIEYVNRLMTHSWGQRVIRFYDLDGNLIEVGTPIESIDSNLQG